MPGSPSADPDFVPPSLGRRFGALIIDWVLCLLVANFFGDPLRDGWPPVLVLILEYGFFVGLFAQTPGMWMTRVRCVSYADGGRIGVIRGLLRGALLCLVVPALIMDDRRRGLHDRLVGSVVVTAVPVNRPAAGA
ncbi:RDD family protein [Micromonospora sonneratiae]|uniref:RDD family protein n=1 Tax=Micromonospora sonneratiae TaxID=1184706 RepID=A0ABW3YRX6_9ACTN